MALPPLLKKNSSGRLKVDFGIERVNSKQNIKVHPDTKKNNSSIIVNNNSGSEIELKDICINSSPLTTETNNIYTRCRRYFCFTF